MRVRVPPRAGHRAAHVPAVRRTDFEKIEALPFRAQTRLPDAEIVWARIKRVAAAVAVAMLLTPNQAREAKRRARIEADPAYAAKRRAQNAAYNARRRERRRERVAVMTATTATAATDDCCCKIELPFPKLEVLSNFSNYTIGA